MVEQQMHDYVCTLWHFSASKWARQKPVTAFGIPGGTASFKSLPHITKVMSDHYVYTSHRVPKSLVGVSPFLCSATFSS